jgi:hypothetical protein
VDPGLIEVTPDKPAKANLTLVSTQDLVSQLTNAEIVTSVPGTDQQKKNVLYRMANNRKFSPTSASSVLHIRTNHD